MLELTSTTLALKSTALDVTITLKQMVLGATELLKPQIY